MDGRLSAGNQYLLIHRKPTAFRGVGKHGDPAREGDKRLLLGILSKKINVYGARVGSFPGGMSNYHC